MSKGKKLTAWVHKHLFPIFIEEYRKTDPLETGGCFMGYWWDSHTEVVITHIIGPGPNAIHRLDSFKPDFAWQQDRIDEVYQGSGRHLTYLGDWHTHQGENPSLSAKDIAALRTVSRYTPANTPVPLMGIVHGGDRLKLALWQYVPPKLIKLLPGNIFSMNIERLED